MAIDIPILPVQARLATDPAFANAPPLSAPHQSLAGLDVHLDRRTVDLDQAINLFQGMLFNEMMKAMRATVPESGLFGKGVGRDIFRGLLDQEYAQAMAQRTGGLGLSEALKRQLCPQGATMHDQRQMLSPPAAAPEKLDDGS